MVKELQKYLHLLRPHQWLKNLLLFFPPFFGGRLMDSGAMASLVPAFFSFSFAASSVYIINDIVDRNADKNHATKKNRPLARGDVSVLHASILAVILYVTAMLLAPSVSERFLGYVIIYLLLSVCYSLFIKHVFLLDIFTISAGYVIRVIAGGEAFHVHVSNWLFLTVFVLSLFLATGKRLSEIIVLGDDASKHRRSLTQYSQSYLEGVVWFAAATAIVMYALYTLERGGTLFYSVPLITYGILRYIYEVRKGNGDPTDVLLKDWHILTVGALWLVLSSLLIYGK